MDSTRAIQVAVARADLILTTTGKVLLVLGVLSLTVLLLALAVREWR